MCVFQYFTLFHLPLQVKGVVSDTASNMKAMMNYLVDMGWSGCLNHRIQLCVNVGVTLS